MLFLGSMVVGCWIRGASYNLGVLRRLSLNFLRLLDVGRG